MTADDARHLIATTKAAASLVASQRSAGDEKANNGDAAGAAEQFKAALTDHQKLVLKPLAAAFRPLPDATEVRSTLAAELADAHGIAGGLLRRLGQEPDAVAEYEHGRLLEEEYQLPATYNRTNALLAAIRGRRISAAELSARAAALAPVARRKLESADRKGRPWALADLGLFLVLAGKPEEVAFAEAYSELLDMADFPKKNLQRVTDDVSACQRDLVASAPAIAEQLKLVADRLTATPNSG